MGRFRQSWLAESIRRHEPFGWSHQPLAAELPYDAPLGVIEILEGTLPVHARKQTARQVEQHPPLEIGQFRGRSNRLDRAVIFMPKDRGQIEILPANRPSVNGF